MTLDSSSAMVFRTPGRCCALRKIFLSMHHSHSSLARQVSCGDIVPPSLLMYVSADTLSILGGTLTDGPVYAPKGVVGVVAARCGVADPITASSPWTAYTAVISIKPPRRFMREDGNIFKFPH